MKKIIVFGLGNDYYLGYYQLNKEYKIVALTDNSKEAREWAKRIELHRGKAVIRPEEITETAFDMVVLAISNSVYIEEITEQLLSMGISKDKIVVQKKPKSTRYLIDPMFYETDLTHEQRMELFANNVESVTIETNSKCNRKCWFCPNSIFDRHSENILMEEETFHKIINELKEIDYNGIITYSFYNEPLLDENIEKKIAFVKEQLPRCIQLISTNGDYLSVERLKSLTDAGLNDLIISVYNENNPKFEWTINKAESRLWYFIEKLNLDVIHISRGEVSVVAYAQKNGLNIRLQNYNFQLYAHNRGETLSDELLLDKREKRTKFCINSFMSLNIYHDGSVYTCGNRRNDCKEHDEFCMGNVKENNIYDIYDSEVAKRFRKNFTHDPNQYPCRSCNFEGESYIPQFPNAPHRDRPRYTRETN